jgi:DNA-directed RNA polymerase specialized sigma24 family protein
VDCGRVRQRAGDTTSRGQDRPRRGPFGRAGLTARSRGEAHRVTFADLAIAAEEPDVDVLSLDEALEVLAKDEPRLAEVVQLRYFTGLGIAETAAVLGTSAATVKRDWTLASAWLLERMS